MFAQKRFLDHWACLILVDIVMFKHFGTIVQDSIRILLQLQPFDGPAFYEAWKNGTSDIPEGRYFCTLSHDVRFCSECAIPVVLSSARIESKPYRWLKDYARDNWIYENYGTMTHNAMSLELEKRKKTDGWKPLSSPNGIKKAAKRYADFHGLPWPKT